MEEKRGVSTHFTGIVRLIAFIVLVLVLLFFVFRWAGNRRAENRAEEAVKTAVDDRESNEVSNEEASVDESEVDSEDRSNQGVVEVPGGVSDSDTLPPTDNEVAPTQNVPSVGMGENIALTAFLVSIVVYLVVRNYRLHEQLKSL